MDNPSHERDKARTTIQVYEEDRNWLQERQRAVSFQRNEHVPMFDLIHELIRKSWIEGEGV